MSYAALFCEKQDDVVEDEEAVETEAHEEDEFEDLFEAVETEAHEEDEEEDDTLIEKTDAAAIIASRRGA